MKPVWNRMTAAQWQASLPPDACAMQQSWRYGAAVAAMGREVHRAELTDGGQAVALVQLVLRTGPLGIRIGYLPRSLIWLTDTDDHMRRKALCLVRQSAPTGVHVLQLAPESSQPGLLPLMTPATLAELPLLADSEAQRGLMAGKWRNRLVRAERAGLKVARSDPRMADLGWLFDREAAQQRANGYRALPPGFIAAWREAARGGVVLYTVRERGAPIAAMLFLDHAPGVSYHIGWNGPEGRAVGAHHLILWRAMRDFAKAGRTRLDLGTLDTVTAPGLARFKLGAGAVARPLGASGVCLPGLRRWPRPRHSVARV